MKPGPIQKEWLDFIISSPEYMVANPDDELRQIHKTLIATKIIKNKKIVGQTFNVLGAWVYLMDKYELIPIPDWTVWSSVMNKPIKYSYIHVGGSYYTFTCKDEDDFYINNNYLDNNCSCVSKTTQELENIHTNLKNNLSVIFKKSI